MVVRWWCMEVLGLCLGEVRAEMGVWRCEKMKGGERESDLKGGHVRVLNKCA
jgi:hypothetical protein